MSHFAHLLPAPDLEPTVSDLWKMTDRLSLQDADDLSQHRLALIEAQEKLGLALAKIGAAS